MKILLALGADPNAGPIGLALDQRRWTVVADAEGHDALQLVSAGGFDAVLLAPDLPEATALVRELRAAAPDLAVLALGPAPSLACKTALFTAGADDVLAHPVHPDEIMLRSLAIARRRHGHGDAAITFGPLSVLPGHHAAVDGRRLPLSRSQFVLLEYLALRAGRVVTRSDLMDALYGGVDEPEQKIIDVFMTKLRSLLRQHGVDPQFIGTVWGRGYSLPRPYGPDAAMPSHLDAVSAGARVYTPAPAMRADARVAA